MTRQIDIITIFAEDDVDCGGDYCAVRIMEGDKQLRHFGDEYHDKGRARAQGYIAALQDMNVDVTITQKNVPTAGY